MSSTDSRRGELPSDTIPIPTALSARIPQHVVFRGFATETVVLNLETGKYHGLNPTGGRMLEVLEKTPNVAEAATKLAAQFGVPLDEIRRDLLTFCEDLAERGLLELDGSSAG
jgi:coenzyme PQQ synthesis protein D (PqqD)